MAATAQIPPYIHTPGRYAQIFATIGLVLFACFGAGRSREREVVSQRKQKWARGDSVVLLRKTASRSHRGCSR